MYYVYSTEFHGRHLGSEYPCSLVSVHNRYPACEIRTISRFVRHFLYLIAVSFGTFRRHFRRVCSRALFCKERDIKAQFRCRASAVPNLSAITFDCGTAKKKQDVMPESNHIQDFLRPRNNSPPNSPWEHLNMTDTKCSLKEKNNHYRSCIDR